MKIACKRMSNKFGYRYTNSTFIVLYIKLYLPHLCIGLYEGNRSISGRDLDLSFLGMLVQAILGVVLYSWARHFISP